MHAPWWWSGLVVDTGQQLAVDRQVVITKKSVEGYWRGTDTPSLPLARPKSALPLALFIVALAHKNHP